MGNLKTKSMKQDEVQQDWWIISAAGQRLGRLASRVARILMGKHKPEYTRHVDTGDFVIITDAEQVVLTGNKLEDKKYYRHSQYPGGLKVETAEELMEHSPEEIVRRAVFGMLPHNRLGRKMGEKLKVYVGSDHPHQAQQPQPLRLEEI
ncbi:MAG: 50S ribosomal protein L13 [Armatimonadetes bacterium]|nr:50S ribosomal protein L13 [Armatimonadota bacterium]